MFVYEKTNPKPASYSVATPGSDSCLNETRLADSVPALTVQGASVLARETWLLGAARGPPFLRHCLLGSMSPSRQELQVDFGPARRTQPVLCKDFLVLTQIRIFIEHPLAPSSLAWAPEHLGGAQHILRQESHEYQPGLCGLQAKRP